MSVNPIFSKGQVISERHFPKNQQIFCKDFCPSGMGQIKKSIGTIIYLYTLSILSTIGMIFLDNLFLWVYWWEPSQKSLQQFPHSYFSDSFLRISSDLGNHLKRVTIHHLAFFDGYFYFKVGFGF